MSSAPRATFAVAPMCALAAALSGCGAEVDSLSWPKMRPATEDVAGHWHIRADSIKNVREWYAPLDASAAAIDLAADGTAA